LGIDLRAQGHRSSQDGQNKFELHVHLFLTRERFG
jgi:hypothetical protein